MNEIDLENAARANFECLNRAETIAAIRSLKSQGFSDLAVAQATRLSIEAIRAALAEHEQ